MHGYVSRGIHPEFDLAAFYLKNPDLDVIANGNGLTALAC
jgi:hypothetical protein